VLSAAYRFSQIMILLTVITISSSWLLTLRFGSVGLIWSNSINMLLRILHRWQNSNVIVYLLCIRLTVMFRTCFCLLVCLSVFSLKTKFFRKKLKTYMFVYAFDCCWCLLC